MKTNSQKNCKIAGLTPNKQGLLVMFWMITGSLATALCGLGIYIFFLRKGQFDDDENVKYQVFREDNPDN